ncbi:hypothetical protein AAU61_08895 [Desulfocarbo indianensis]|nr:hypothetical protein AAU61_08895 [Desulfocarbo indianensis]
MNQGQPETLCMKREAGTFSLILGRSCGAEDVLERMPRLLRSVGLHARLAVDVSQAQGLDNLALSALVVCLRNQAVHLDEVVLCGLPPWAYGRLCLTGAHRVLGPGWLGRLDPECLHLQREAA